MDGDLSDAAAAAVENLNCTKRRSPPPSLHSEGRAVANGLPEPGGGGGGGGPPPRPTTGGVGRRTSVLFKKAKNGAKLFRDRDNPLVNGKADDNSSAASTPSSTPLSTPLSTPSKTPQKSPAPPTLNQQWTPVRDACSDGELEKTPRHTLESGEHVLMM